MGYIARRRSRADPAMLRDRLSDTKIRQAKPRPKAYKLTDGGGLFVLVHPNGSRYWRLKYRSNGKEKLFAIGVYPEISLAQARGKALEARQLIRDGVDPVVERRRWRSEAGSDSASFQVIAEEWIATRANEWAPTYREAVRSALAANLYPQIGGYPVRMITVPVMREALLLMQRRGALAALRKVRMWASLVFRYAIATGRADIDPAAPLRGTFKAHKGRNFAAVTKAEEFGTLIAKVRGYDGSPVTRVAMLLLAYTFVRTGELRGAEWSEYDMLGALWRIPGEADEDGRGAPRSAFSPGAGAVVGAEAAHRPFASSLPERAEAGRADEREYGPLCPLSPGLSQSGNGSRLPVVGVHAIERARLRSGRNRAPARPSRAEQGSRGLQ